jgi:hypothetical protein
VLLDSHVSHTEVAETDVLEENTGFAKFKEGLNYI